MRAVRTFTLLALALSAALSFADANRDAQVLAGVERIGGTDASTNLARIYRSHQSLFRVENERQMREFFASKIPKARKTRGLIYLFGGPDALFPEIIFPHYQRLLLVGLEPAGDLPATSEMMPEARNRKIVDIARAYGNSLKNSYFITTHMAKDLAEYGTTTIIAAGLAVQGYQILGLDKVSLNKEGGVEPGHGNSVKGVRIAFRRRDKSTAEIFYFQYNLADDNMTRNPELARFIRAHQFDTAFYKAASYVSHIPGFKMINSLVLDQVSLLVQADDGIPYAFLAQPERARQWQMKLFGLYTPPDKMFQSPVQADLRALFGAEICAGGAPQDQELWLKVWPTRACDEAAPYGFRRVRWEGYLPFRFGYAAISGPKVVPWTEMHKFGTLMVLER